MEKLSWNAAVTRMMAASKMTANDAIPARRAVSVRRAEPEPLRESATIPARQEYPLRPRASNRQKLPMIDIDVPAIFSESNRRGNWSISEAPGFRRDARLKLVVRRFV